MIDTGGNDMKSVLIALVLVFALAAPACGEWVEGEFEIPSFMSMESIDNPATLRLVANALFIIDWGQTRYAAHPPHLYKEANPILGPNPSDSEITTYFLGVMMLYNLAYYVLPEKWFRTYSWLVIGSESFCVAVNFSVGVKMEF
jgi:hypothetical protein